MFVTFEGIDGSGKTTVINRLKEILPVRLKAANFNGGIWTTREPTDTVVGRGVAALAGMVKDRVSQARLFLVDRAEHVDEIGRHVRAGELVLCDRFADSTMVYQYVWLNSRGDLQARSDVYFPDCIGGYGESAEKLLSVGCIPDLTILLDVSPAVAASRIAARGTEEPVGRERLDLLSRRYRNLANINARTRRRIVRVPADDDLNTVTERCALHILYRMMGRTKNA